MSRLAPLTYDTLTPEQKRVSDAIAKSRGSAPGGAVGGPFGVWLRSPDFADRAQSVGDFCRYHTLLPQYLVEFAIIITARYWKAQIEWRGHARLAIEAGLPEAIAEDVRVGKKPTLRDAKEQAVYDLTTEYFADHRVSDATYRAAVEQFGEQGVVELVGIIGYYSMVAASLNVFDVSLPDGEPLPLK